MVALKALLLPATVCAFVPSSRLPLAPRSVSGRTTVTAVYGTPRPVQIIPSVLPADWANMVCCACPSSGTRMRPICVR